MSIEQRMTKLGTALITALGEDIKEHGASFQTYALHLDALAGVTYSTIRTIGRYEGEAVAVALIERFRSLSNLDRVVDELRAKAKH